MATQRQTAKSAVANPLSIVRGLLDTKYGADKPYATFNELYAVPKTSSGSLRLDWQLGGGLADGKIYNLYGPESSGKTAIATMIAGTYQQAGLPVMWGDAENAFDPIYAKNTFNFDATDSNTVLYMPEQNGGILYSTAELCAKNGFKLVVIDSTDAMLTSAEVESEYGDAMMAQKARLNSIALAKLVGILSKHGCSIILISQERMKMSYGGGLDISGGKAIKYYSSVRLRVTKLEMIKEKGNDDVVGQKLNILCQKNKLGIPFRNIEMNLYYNKGFDKTSELVDLAIELDIVRSSGAWCYYGEEKWNGKAKFSEWLLAPEQDKLRADLEVLVRQALTNSIKSAEVEVPVIDPTKVFETDIEKELKASDNAIKEKKARKGNKPADSEQIPEWEGGDGE